LNQTNLLEEYYYPEKHDVHYFVSQSCQNNQFSQNGHYSGEMFGYFAKVDAIHENQNIFLQGILTSGAKKSCCFAKIVAILTSQNIFCSGP
jgi:hypothetical protein